MILKLMPYLLSKVESASEVEGAAYTKDDIVERPYITDIDDETKIKEVSKWFEK